ncbi:hypothetical protein IQ235_04160 [Oscillatoriales cyanobacterium LEGE 11467]|uniref:Uncharacterized protein n=1 Tax=Zarconia navalis LEGE 11467 TaxID=1828826 RepID=A0A928Z6Y0_9CYAN|nr:hypothetical protein [Zarconia navalis]MBE9039985.1 hypothetical protein [Zarconia navalis LEGE 11467]
MSSFNIRTDVSCDGDRLNLLRWSTASDRLLESSLIDACFGGGENPRIDFPSPCADRAAGWGMLGMLVVLGAALFGEPTRISSPSQNTLLDSGPSLERNRSIGY